jgi:hypothetical protein
VGEHVRGTHSRPFALQRERADRTPGKAVLDHGFRRHTDEDRSWICLPLQPRGHVDHVACRAVLDPRAGADRTQHSRASLDADPDGEVVDVPALRDFLGVPRDRPHGPKATQDRPLGVVFVRDRGAEEGKNTVPSEILDGATQRVDEIDDAGQCSTHHVTDIFRIELLGQRGRVGDVGEPGCDYSPFRTHGCWVIGSRHGGA